MCERSSCADFAFVTAAPFVDMTALSALAGFARTDVEGQESIIESAAFGRIKILSTDSGGGP